MKAIIEFDPPRPEAGMKITDEIRAAVYRELADNMDSFDTLDAEGLRERADEKDQPRPEPGPIVFENGIRGMVLQGRSSFECKYDIVTEYGELLMFEDAMPWKPARILAPDEVVLAKDVAESLMGVLRSVDYVNSANILKEAITRAEAMEAE